MNRSLEELKQKYGEVFSAVSAALFEADPVGINFNSNTDEYEPEAGTIVPRLGLCNGPSDVQQVVYEEFLRWFSADTVGPRSQYESVSSAIWQIWEHFNGLAPEN